MSKNEKSRALKPLLASGKNLRFYTSFLSKNATMVGLRGKLYGLLLFSAFSNQAGSKAAQDHQTMILASDRPDNKSLAKELPDFIRKYYPQISKKLTGKTVPLEIGRQTEQTKKNGNYEVKF